MTDSVAPPDPSPSYRPAVFTEELARRLAAVSTASLTSQLQRRGMRSMFLNGLRPLRTGTRMVGYAHTLRYLPLREDLQPGLSKLGVNAQRRAVESVQPDEVLIIEARNEPDAGTIGDILAVRAERLGGAGIVTDGALRDTPAIRDLGIAVYHRSSHAATLMRVHMPYEHQVAVACAGVTVMPGDIVVGDDEGVVVIPPALVEEILEASERMEAEEAFAFERVAAGESSVGLFPLSEARRADFEAWLTARSEEDPS